MSTGSSLIVFKTGVVTALSARPGLVGVQVTYEYPIASITGADIWLGDAEAVTTIPVMRSGVLKVDENYSMLIIAQVLKTQDEGQAAADIGAVALLREVQQMFAETPQTVPDIQWATVNGWKHKIGPFGVDDSGGNVHRGSRFEIQIGVRARLGT
jgi:hypothetical protein